MDTDTAYQLTKLQSDSRKHSLRMDPINVSLSYITLIGLWNKLINIHFMHSHVFSTRKFDFQILSKCIDSRRVVVFSKYIDFQISWVI